MINPRYPLYDMARGGSALVVFFAHALAIFLFRYVGTDHWSAAVCGAAAKYAVLIFFLLSGFLITNSILENCIRHGTFSIADYLTSRVARIYPPLIGSILVVCAIDAIIQGFCLPGCTPYGLPGDLYRPRELFEFSRGEVVLALRMHGGLLEVNGPLWTLYVEFNIYLIAMGVAAVLTWKGPLAKTAGLAITVAAIFNGIPVNEHFIFFVVIWCIGSAFASPLIARVKRQLFAAAVLSCLILICLALYDLSLFHPTRYDLAGEAVAFAACLATAYVLFIADWPTRLHSDWLARTGGFSYSLYILHWPLLLFALSLTQGWSGSSLVRSTLAMLAGAVLTLSATIVLARWLERTKPAKQFLLQCVGILRPK